MSYRVVTKSGQVEVVEKGTELVVHQGLDADFARRLCRGLNLGHGFNGFTPTFFTTKYPHNGGELIFE